MTKILVLAAALALTALAQAQTAAPTKKELVTKVLQLQQSGVEQMAAQLVQQPAAQIAMQVGPALQRMPQERREALGRDIDADLRKYAEEVTPVARERAVKLAPGTIGVLLEERFSEDELKQLIGIFESPVNRKFQGMAGEMQKAFGEKLVSDLRSIIEPKARAMAESVNRRMGGGSAPAPSAASGARR